MHLVYMHVHMHILSEKYSIADSLVQIFSPKIRSCSRDGHTNNTHKKKTTRTVLLVSDFYPTYLVDGSVAWPRPGASKLELGCIAST